MCIRPVPARQAAPRAGGRALARSWLRSVGHTQLGRPQRAPREAATVARRATAAGERALQALTDAGAPALPSAGRPRRPTSRTHLPSLRGAFLSVNCLAASCVRDTLGRAGAPRALPSRPRRLCRAFRQFQVSDLSRRRPPTARVRLTRSPVPVHDVLRLRASCHVAGTTTFSLRYFTALRIIVPRSSARRFTSPPRRLALPRRDNPALFYVSALAETTQLFSSPARNR